MKLDIDRETLAVLTTTARYMILIWLAIRIKDQTNHDIRSLKTRPNWQDGVLISSRITAAYWIAGHFLGVLFLLWLPGGPVYARLIAGIASSFLAAWMGYLSGAAQWRINDVQLKESEWQKFLAEKE